MYSNAYIFRYATIMVVLVAAILTAANTVLKPYQERNLAVDKMKGILASAGVEATPKDAIELYAQNITTELAIDPEGNIVGEYKDGKLIKGDERPFDIVMKEELYNESTGKPYTLPLYIAEVRGEKIYIVPLYGKGLWGPVWGNMALSGDFSTVLGVSFDHKQETPGLGAEINTKAFQHQFIDKRIFNQQGDFMSIRIVKGGISAIPENLRIHGVDAISGGTITCNGVADMLNDCLKLYVPFEKKHIK